MHMYPRARYYSPPSLLSASNIPRVDHIHFGGFEYVSPWGSRFLGVHVFVPLYGGFEEENGQAPRYENFDYRYESSEEENSEEESGGEESSE